MKTIKAIASIAYHTVDFIVRLPVDIAVTLNDAVKHFVMRRNR